MSDRPDADAAVERTTAPTARVRSVRDVRSLPAPEPPTLTLERLAAHHDDAVDTDGATVPGVRRP